MFQPLTPAHRADYLALVQAFYGSDAVDHPIPLSHAEATFDAIPHGSPLPAGHPPDLVQAAQLIQAADEGRPQAGGRPGYQCDIHANASLPRCFLYCTPKRAAHASPPECRTGSPDPLRTPCILFHGPVFRRPELTSPPKACSAPT